jgi:hypothetical protein
MGLNDRTQSYIVGISPDGAAFPQRPTVRPEAGPPNFNDPGNNPVDILGALVNGPSEAGQYQDSRQQPRFNGIGILNNAPLSLLISGLKGRDLVIEDCVGFRPRSRVRSLVTTPGADTGGNPFSFGR